jgi:zinc transport system permease protein
VIEMLQHDFMVRAFIVGSLIGISAALLGPFLVLRRYAMIGDGLAHVSFASVSIALILGTQPVIFSIPLVILASFGILKLTETANVYADAAIGLMGSFAVALGVLLASLGKGFSVDLYSYLFGSILVIKQQEVWLTVILTIVMLALIAMFYRDLFALTYDEEYAQTQKLPTRQLNYFISGLTAVTIVLGIRVVGTMLISSMIIFPAVTALQLAKSFRMTFVYSSLVALISVITGISLSYIFNLPTGASIVMINAVLFVLAFVTRKIRA